MVAIEIYTYVSKTESKHIDTVYGANDLYDKVHKYWKASERNKRKPIILKYVNKREEPTESDRDYKDQEAEQLFTWFVSGNNKTL
jgi:hypothetical protein